MGAVADSMKLPYKEFGPFSRVNPPLTDPVVVGTAFGLDVGQRSGMLDTKDGIYFMKALEHTKADSAAFTRQLRSPHRHSEDAVWAFEALTYYMTTWDQWEAGGAVNR